MQKQNNDNLYILSAIGKDLVGLVSIITSEIYEHNCNIVDIRQNVAHGFFSAFIIIDITNAKLGIKELTENIHSVSNQTGLEIIFEKFKEGRRKTEKKIISINLIGKDRPGIVANTSITMSDYSINIEDIKMLARGELIIMNILADSGDMAEDIESMKQKLKESMNKIDIGVSFQTENIFTPEKKVIIFNLNDDFIKNQIIKAVNADDTLKNKIIGLSINDDFTAFSKYLRNVDAGKIGELLAMIKPSPDAFEIMAELKSLGFKIALVSNGANFLPDRLKDLLKLDHTFANSLELKNNKFTGMAGDIIFNNKKKNDIMNYLSKFENISISDIVMVENAGLNLLEILIDTDDFTEHLSGMYNDKKMNDDEIVSLSALVTFK